MTEGAPLHFHHGPLNAQASFSAGHPDNIEHGRTGGAVQALTARMRERVVRGNSDALHLRGDAEKGGTRGRGEQALGCGDEEREKRALPPPASVSSAEAS